jgi:hypothetical protein
VDWFAIFLVIAVLATIWQLIKHPLPFFKKRK